MKKFFTKEVKIAITVIVCLVALFFGINFLKGVNLLQPSNYYNIAFKNVSGLALSAPVTIEGYKVGLVRDITYDAVTGGINVEIGIDDDVRLTKGTTATLATDLLGTATVALNVDRTSNEYYLSGDTLPVVVSEGMMSSIENELMPQITNLLPKLDSILTGVNKVVNGSSLDRTMQNLDMLTADLAAASDELSKLMKNSVPSLVSNIDTASANIKELTARLDEVEIEAIASSLDSTLANIKQLTDKMNDKNSSIGLLFNETGVYDGIVKALASADSLLIDLREHPKRYVHFSLIGRKEK